MVDGRHATTPVDHVWQSPLEIRVLVAVQRLFLHHNGRGKEGRPVRHQVIETAQDAGIKIYAFGAHLQDDAFLTSLSRASERTHGVYQRIDEPESLEGAIRELAPQLKKQYVVDLTVDYPGMPSDNKVKLRVDAETPNAESVSAVYPKSVKFTELPTRWWFYVKWVLIVLGSLIGLWLIIWIFFDLTVFISSFLSNILSSFLLFFDFSCYITFDT